KLLRISVSLKRKRKETKISQICALMHYAGSRNSMEHGLPLLEVYCLSINCFASARSHLTAESDRVALVLKRLLAHDALLRYGSTDLQALLQITGEGGAWSSPVLSSLLSGQLTDTDEVNSYISLEGEGFMEMRVKHLEKLGEVAKAVVLAKACSECSFVSNQAMFRQTFVSLLCHLLPSEEAITEISRLDCKDVLEITSNLETEGEENTAFILCTTFLTQQLQQQSLHSSWDLMLLWSKLQRRLDPSLMSLLERCLQLGAIAKTVLHLLYLVRVIQTEVEEHGTPASVELCVKALQLPRLDDSESRISVCKTVSRLLSDDLEVLRACQLTEFLLGPSQDSFTCLEELYSRSDQKYDQETGTIPNSLRCELLLALKTYWPFDPEFWDWKTLKYQCASLLGLKLEPEGEEEEVEVHVKQNEGREVAIKAELEQQNTVNVSDYERRYKNPLNHQTDIKGKSKEKKQKFYCQICRRSVSDNQIVHHSKRHAVGYCHPCPVCLEKFKSRKELVAHLEKHINGETSLQHADTRKDVQQKMDEVDDDDDIEPGEINIDPSLMLYYKSTHDPDVLDHIVEQTKTVPGKQADDDEHVTFEYIEQHFKIQNREMYPCPGTGCTRVFKHSKYLYVHLRSEHKGDENVKYFHQMRDKREKCLFCRRHFVSAYHYRKHRRIHYGERPYTCMVVGCGAQFKTSNELIRHKQTHDYQLNYQCELSSCSVTYSDLGQVYHHEAQHFRDAAFTCTSADCKNFYFSKKEFLKHLHSHNITFSEEDIEAQRRKRRKLLKMDAVHFNPAMKDTGVVINSSPIVCESTLQRFDSTEPKTTMTLVAVCFDGSKFTCGFEKCGMSFSRARDVQRHLKCAHPEHLKLENKTHKQDREQESISKGVKTEPESGIEMESNNELPPASQTVAAGTDRNALCPSQSPEVNSLSLPIDNDALNEIVIKLSQLNLDPSSPCNVQCESTQSNLDTQNIAQISLHQEILAKPPVVLLQKRPDLLKAKVHIEKDIELLANSKPFACEIKKCGFRTAQSFSLRRHYCTIHGRTYEQAKSLTSSENTNFRPFVCVICAKGHRQKSVLRAHYIQTHTLSKALINKLSLSPGKSLANQKPTSWRKKTSQSLKIQSVTEEPIESPNLQPQDEKKDLDLIAEDGQKCDSILPIKEEVENQADGAETEDLLKRESGDKTKQLRTTRRLVAKNNLCYMLDRFNKPFHCVAKNCDAAFSTQGGLVRHLQIVHHYNRSQLLLEKDLDVPRSVVKKEPAKKRPHPNSEEPQRQFQCHFANCSSSYHLKSSLVRHTRDSHLRPSEQVRCKFNGCTKVFSNKEELRKHTLYSHCELYDSLVVRLQSTQKKSISGCQKKLIVPQLDAPKEEPCSPTVEATLLNPSNKTSEESMKSKTKMKCFVFRSHEEALQMCQDRCTRIAFPCMVKHCDSVVTYSHSLHRHYLRVHGMQQNYIAENVQKLVFTAEKLEEIIQKKSVQLAIKRVCSLNGVNKVENEVKAVDPEQQPTPENLQAKADAQVEDKHGNSGEFQDEPPTKKVILVGADVVKNGEPGTVGNNDQHVTTWNRQKQEEHLGLDKIRPLLRHLTIDLSPPCSLQIHTKDLNNKTSRKVINGSNSKLINNFSNKDDGMSVDSSNGKGSNELVNGSTLLPSPSVCIPPIQEDKAVQPPKDKEKKPLYSSQIPFTPSEFKPLGFESSFLQFIQDATPKEKPQTPVIGEFTSVQNLKSILDKALAGCGDLAIKQLQYLRPVVVLGRPVCSSTVPDLFQSDTNKSKLLLGS
uniref:C2H2-type domain-containing protein n=1 Tax=Gouania willdenowi TaxID=441366 RepID=A0A8C5GWN7_GOUWI